jgi:hypothetical protein
MPNLIKSLLILLLAVPAISHSQSPITLRRSFIDSFKNRVTITTEYDVWYTHHKAKKATEDGDIHCSGYDKKIGMPVVAEIMNAKDEEEAIELLIEHEGKGKAHNPTVAVTGVWRLWPEHMGAGSSFYKGMKLSKAKIQAKTTNPDHVFEIHPVTQLSDIYLTSTLHNIKGYSPHDAKKAIGKIEEKACSISSKKKTITFSTSQIGYNYIDLWIRVDSSWLVDDGAFATCTLLKSGFNPESSNVTTNTLAKKIRVAFVKDSEAYIDLVAVGDGQFLHILGTPRINLAVLEWREWVSKKRPEVLTWTLPYEIIAGGIIE